MSDRKMTFNGTHKSIGTNIGQLYRKWGKKEILLPPLINEYFSKQLQIYEKYFPQYLEYLEGISIGLEINKDRVFQSYLTGFLHIAWAKPSNKCSAFVAKNNKGVFIGRNYDWRESSEESSKIADFKFSDRSSNNFVGISDMGTWEIGVNVGSEKYVLSIDEAWNNKGLYIALNGAPGKKRTNGMSTPHLIQLVAEKANTTDDAINLLSKVPIPESKIFIVGDSSGKMAVVEKSIEKGTKIREATDFIIATNHYNHPNLLSENIQIFNDVPFHSTFTRYSYLQYNLESIINRLDLDTVNRLMSKPPVIQNWRGRNMGDVITVWSTSLNLSDLNYKIQLAPLKAGELIYDN